MRASRLLAILILLQMRARLTARALADEFEVSVRTIYRDIDELSAAGVPVYADRGPGGGFQLLDGWRTQLTGLGGDEAEALSLVGLPGPAAALGLGASAKRASIKLAAALPAAQRDQAGRLGQCFHIDPVDWYREADPAPHLPALVRAILDQHAVRIAYDSWSGSREHRLEPLGLVMKGGHWYLMARRGERMATFKVANVRALSVGPGRFERPAEFDLASHWQSQLRDFEARLRPSRARLRTSAEGRRKLAEQGDFAAAAMRAARPDSNGMAEVVLPVETIDQAAALVLGLAGEVEALDPPELRARIAELGARLAALHAGSRPAAA